VNCARPGLWGAWLGNRRAYPAPEQAKRISHESGNYLARPVMPIVRRKGNHDE
jgi:hypothetical protein